MRLPRQRVCPILPGVRSFLNYEGEELVRGGRGGKGKRGGGRGGSAFAGMSMARSGMWRSPITRTRRDVILGFGGARAGLWVVVVGKKALAVQWKGIGM